MRIRAGLLPYLNSVVFYSGMPWEGVELSALPPRPMAEAVERGELDAGPLPVADVLRMGDAVRPLGDLCVATRDASASVLLFSRLPADRLGGASIGVTGQTSSSVQLLRVLFADYWRVTPGSYGGLTEGGDALLYIGDEALRHRRGIEGLPHVYDLAAEWRLHTGLPFVFARWVARREVSEEASAVLLSRLEESLQRALTRPDEAFQERPDLAMSQTDVADYLGQFSYRLGPEERAGLAEFARRLAALPEWRRTGKVPAGASGNRPAGTGR